MNGIKGVGLAVTLTGALTLGACTATNAPPYGPVTEVSTPTGTAYSGYGVVQSIELVQQDRAGIGLGTVAGAVVGGVAGNQVGSGSGNTAATVLGAAGGAYVGHELEKRHRQQTADAYRITVRMNDGSYQTVVQSSAADLRVGDRVRIGDGMAYRY